MSFLNGLWSGFKHWYLNLFVINTFNSLAPTFVHISKIRDWLPINYFHVYKTLSLTKNRHTHTRRERERNITVNKFIIQGQIIARRLKFRDTHSLFYYFCRSLLSLIVSSLYRLYVINSRGKTFFFYRETRKQEAMD